MDFLKGIRVMNPHNKLDIHRFSSETTDFKERVCDSKDSIEIHFEYSDIKKLRLEYLVGHPVPDCYGYKIEITPFFSSELLNLNQYLD